MQLFFGILSRSPIQPQLKSEAISGRAETSRRIALYSQVLAERGMPAEVINTDSSVM